MGVMQKLKEKLKKLRLKLLRKLNYKTSRPSLNDLDRRLEKYLDHKNGFFIECGANDGYSQSNTFYLEKKLRWRGVLIEGIPELYAKCKVLRKRSIVYNCALVSADFTEATVTMHYAHLMSLVNGARKTLEQQSHHLERAKNLQPNIQHAYTVDVPARTLESILDDIPNLPQIDFFSLDVEGYELEVLKGLNFERYRPRYLLVEANYYDEVNGFLILHDYRVIEKLTHHDYLYIDNRS